MTVDPKTFEQFEARYLPKRHAERIAERERPNPWLIGSTP